MEGLSLIWSRKRKWVVPDGKGAKEVPKEARERKKAMQ